MTHTQNTGRGCNAAQENIEELETAAGQMSWDWEVDYSTGRDDGQEWAPATCKTPRPTPRTK